MDLQTTITSLQNRDYTRLDTLFNALQKDFERGAISEWHLQSLLSVHALRRMDLVARMVEWSLRFPRSYAAHAALAHAYVGLARELQKYLPTQSVSLKGQQLIHEYLSEAVLHVEKALGLSAMPCTALEAAVLIQQAAAIDLPRDYLALAQHHARFSLSLTQRVLHALNPRWLGDEDAFESFFNELQSQKWSPAHEVRLQAAYLSEQSDIALSTGDVEEALRLGRKALANCNQCGHSHWALARALTLAGKHRQAEDHLMRAVEHLTSGNCWYELGRLRQLELKDRVGAISAYEKAAELGHGEAAARCAELQLKYVERKREEDPQLYERIARYLDQGMQHHSLLAFNLRAGQSVNGDGVAKRPADAVPFWKDAAQLGCATSSYNLGLIYWEGSEGLEADAQQAFQFMERAVRLGKEEAFGALGRMYYQGHGVRQDFDAALHYLALAADDDAEHALADLARMHWLGHGTQVNRPRAERYLARLRECDPDLYREVNDELRSWTGALRRGMSGWLRRAA